ncbi:MAG: response regulator, partial [Saprospiraceae bacterium]|nr:response regulator [Saprospiraceae bacterium]
MTIYSLPSQAQKATLEFFSQVDGLAGNIVSKPAQDDSGLMWVVCDGKLQRFEGDRFVTHPGRPGYLPGVDELLLEITSYQDSFLLLASAHHLYLFRPASNQWEAFSINSDFFFRDFKYVNQDLVCFSVNKRGATEDLSIMVFQDGIIKPFKPLEGKNFGLRPKWMAVGQFFMDGDSIVYHIEDGVIRKIAMDGTILKERQLPPPIGTNDLAKFGPDKILILHLSKFYTIDLNLENLTPHSANRLLFGASAGWYNFVLVEENGSFWADGQNENLLYYDVERDTVYNFQNEMGDDWASLLNEMFIDNTGILWIKTERGLLKVSFIKLPFATFFDDYSQTSEGFPYKLSFRGITEGGEGNIYATFYIGLASINALDDSKIIIENQKEWIPFEIAFKNQKVYLNNGYTMDPATGKRQFVAGATGIGTQDRGVFTEDDKGLLYRIVWDTLYRLDDLNNPEKWVPEIAFPIPNPKESFPEVLYFSKGEKKILVGCRNFLYSYDLKTRSIESFDQENWGIPIYRIMAIEEAGPGIYWLATDIGLVKFNTHTNAVEKFATPEGLCNDFIGGMLAEGDSALWLGTNQGLSRFSIASSKFVNFFIDDGLTTNEFNRASYYKAKNGRMFFGGLHGVNAFFPEEIMESYLQRNQKARIILTGFDKVDEKRGEKIKEISFSDKPQLHLYHWDRSFEFHYLLTDYTRPDEIRYAYKLEGYEDRWSEYSKDNSIRFSSLPVGDYTLKVKALDHHGMEHPNQLSVSLTVHPPWWETTWAYILYFLILSGISYTIFRFYMRRWKLQLELEKEHEEAMRLKELDTFKSRLYTNLTHEFRTPLTVILGMTDQVEEDPKQHMQEGLDLIRKNGTQLLNLINQLLDLSKLENNVFQLQLVQGDIIAYLRYLGATFKAFAQKHKISLSLQAETDQVIMDFDPEQIKQVMNNLISNAVKFTPSGGTIDINVRQENQELVLEVKDSGGGINASDLEHIFDRFYQAESSESRRWEGSGIGLAHTRELISLMDGKIEVDSNADPRKGPTWTCFSIRLPIRKGENIPAAGLIDIPEAMGETKSETKNIQLNSGSENATLPQLLIVEDNPDVVAYLVSCLRGDYQIDVAVNGREGLEKAIEGIPDLIISDVMMPEMDGFELCGILKNDERTSHIPIILLTAKADVKSRLAGLRHGADFYLSKPFHQEELLVTIENLMVIRKKLHEKYSKVNLEASSSRSDTVNTLPDPEDIFLQKFRTIVEQRMSDTAFEMVHLEKALGMSRSQIYRKVKALTGKSPSLFIRSIRLHQGRHLLLTTDLTISEIAY